MNCLITVIISIRSWDIKTWEVIREWLFPAISVPACRQTGKAKILTAGIYPRILRIKIFAFPDLVKNFSFPDSLPDGFESNFYLSTNCLTECLFLLDYIIKRLESVLLSQHHLCLADKQILNALKTDTWHGRLFDHISFFP